MKWGPYFVTQFFETETYQTIVEYPIKIRKHSHLFLLLKKCKLGNMHLPTGRVGVVPAGVNHRAANKC